MFRIALKCQFCSVHWIMSTALRLKVRVSTMYNNTLSAARRANPLVFGKTLHSVVFNIPTCGPSCFSSDLEAGTLSLPANFTKKLLRWGSFLTLARTSDALISLTFSVCSAESSNTSYFCNFCNFLTIYICIHPRPRNTK